jgi:hypothetical protein
MLRSLFVLLFVVFVYSHEESGPWSCESGSEIRVESEFQPGLITLDGHADDWKSIDGSHFSLLLALDPDAENEFNGGKMTVKVLYYCSLFCFLCPFLLFAFFSSPSVCCFVSECA